MNRRSAILAGVVLSAATLTGCTSMGTRGPGWVTLLDGTNLNDWTMIGDANWRIADGSAQADRGKSGFLVSKKSYADFQIRAEFWTDPPANSGIFIRATNPKEINAKNSYEVNIYDQRPDPAYGTGAIVDVAKVSPPIMAGGKWNVYEITAKGPVFTVTLNGVRTVDGARDSAHARGQIGLQYAGGVVKFRKFEIREL
jgi:hypothetical protein